jgi:cytochrome c oxidase cbb3-type subunit 3
MTRNILIATIFSLATAILLGFVFINESGRLPKATAAISAEQIERGARDYEQYCATCHGLAGQGGVQYAAPQLNNISARYLTADASGTAPFDAPNGIKEKYGTLRNYMEATLYSGIRGAPMPAFGATGTMRQDQIENVVSYVLSWNNNVPAGASTAAALAATAAAPTPDPNANPVSQGELVFKNKGCVGCHSMAENKLVGPGLGGLFQEGGTAAFGTQLPNGKEVSEENVLEWIRGGSAGFPENNNDLQGNDYTPMPAIQVTDDEYASLLVWLQAHNRDGSLTEEAQQIIQDASGGQTAPPQQTTAQPTGQPNQPAAPNSPAGPGSTSTP